jgi:hypothetical protein
MTERNLLRNGILAGLGFCVLMVAYSIHRYPEIVASPGTLGLLFVFLAGILWLGIAAVRCTSIETREDFVVLSQGLRWGWSGLKPNAPSFLKDIHPA